MRNAGHDFPINANIKARARARRRRAIGVEDAKTECDGVYRRNFHGKSRRLGCKYPAQCVPETCLAATHGECKFTRAKRGSICVFFFFSLRARYIYAREAITSTWINPERLEFTEYLVFNCLLNENVPAWERDTIAGDYLWNCTLTNTRCKETIFRSSSLSLSLPKKKRQSKKKIIRLLLFASAFA